ncbi:HIT domain-containing protein [uncultured Brevundimonas sp.]|uniref:HIT domain-containing protein n=1 Tax=uncultured Brevundimonas sp. TaxID=213418 RepID=UPI0025D5F4C9|nr:HIT domain-containing protein [uncultured Brevundimonas sp.]
MGFEVAPAFEAGSVAITEWPLCHVRLQDDARFPWLILIPRVDGAVELEDLSVEQRATLMEETVRAGALVRRLGAVEKLNVGAIGNVTAQLHVHVVGRRRDDGLWPDPVWGRGLVIPYADDERARRLAIVAGG